MVKNKAKVQPGLFDDERTCPVCGRTFTANMDWAYKRRRGPKAIYFCRWSCMRSYDSGRAKPNGHGARAGSKKEKIFQMLDDGLNTKEISTLMGVNPSTVTYYKMFYVKKDENEKELRK